MLKSLHEAPRAVSPEDGYFLAAQQIAFTLCRDAVWADEQCNWLGWSMVPLSPKNLPVYSNCEANIYCGTAGISLFLAHIQNLAPDDVIFDTLSGALKHATHYADFYGIGYFTGKEGIASALITAGYLCEQPAWIDIGRDIIVKSAKAIDPALISDKQLDMVGGLAGVIPLYLHYADLFDLKFLHNKAVEFGQSLLAKSHQDISGISWPSEMPRTANLTGYAHGTSGILSALIDLHKATNDPVYLDVAAKTLTYERNSFDTASQRWQDFRIKEIDPALASPTANGTSTAPHIMQAEVSDVSQPVAWCHGALGIGYARLRCLDTPLETTKCRDEIELVRKLAQGLLKTPRTAGDFGLCHGLCGAADFLLEADSCFKTTDSETAKDGIADFGDVLKEWSHSGLPWPCGADDQGDNPTLLQGTAGIGMTLLRMSNPDKISSPLVISAASS